MAVAYPHTSSELFQRNDQYVLNHKSPKRFSPEAVASPKILIISCLDQRVVPEYFFKLDTNEVPTYRNAGGRAHRAVLDAALLDVLTSVAEILVIHHTNCGLTFATEEMIRDKFAERSGMVYDVNFGCFPESNIDASLQEDVSFLRAHPLIRKETVITGAVYDIETGKVTKVAEA